MQKLCMLRWRKKFLCILRERKKYPTTRPPPILDGELTSITSMTGVGSTIWNSYTAYEYLYHLSPHWLGRIHIRCGGSQSFPRCRTDRLELSGSASRCWPLRSSDPRWSHDLLSEARWNSGFLLDDQQPVQTHLDWSSSCDQSGAWRIRWSSETGYWCLLSHLAVLLRSWSECAYACSVRCDLWRIPQGRFCLMGRCMGLSALSQPLRSWLCLRWRRCVQEAYCYGICSDRGLWCWDEQSPQRRTYVRVWAFSSWEGCVREACMACEDRWIRRLARWDYGTAVRDHQGSFWCRRWRLLHPVLREQEERQWWLYRICSRPWQFWLQCTDVLWISWWWRTSQSLWLHHLRRRTERYLSYCRKIIHCNQTL